MKTPLGKYLASNKSNRSKISRITGITEDRLNALSNESSAILYADELYKILFVAHNLTGISPEQFDDLISIFFPNRTKGALINKFDNLSPTARLFTIYTLPKREVETTIGMSKNKLSKFSSGLIQRASALELINFCDALNLDILATCKDLFGEIRT